LAIKWAPFDDFFLRLLAPAGCLGFDGRVFVFFDVANKYTDLEG